MNFVVEPSALKNGTVTVPGDKSISHRALIFSALAHGRSTISGLLHSDDGWRENGLQFHDEQEALHGEELA